MKQIKKFSDTRLEGYCVYCGGLPETRDHVPSKILLDSPFPENLPVVPCCNKCNHGFSKDEEYFACLLECVLRGTTDPDELKRGKVKDILERKPKLRSKLTEAMENNDGQTYFRTEDDRLRNVILKLARGHAAYENSESQFEEPYSVRIQPIILMSDEERENFFSHKKRLLPEVGSRALQRLFFEDETVINDWITVQEDNYVYTINHGSQGLTVKILIWNYLTCEVVWE